MFRNSTHDSKLKHLFWSPQFEDVDKCRRMQKNREADLKVREYRGSA